MSSSLWSGCAGHKYDIFRRKGQSPSGQEHQGPPGLEPAGFVTPRSQRECGPWGRLSERWEKGLRGAWAADQLPDVRGHCFSPWNIRSSLTAACKAQRSIPGPLDGRDCLHKRLSPTASKRGCRSQRLGSEVFILRLLSHLPMWLSGFLEGYFTPSYPRSHVGCKEGLPVPLSTTDQTGTARTAVSQKQGTLGSPEPPGN